MRLWGEEGRNSMNLKKRKTAGGSYPSTIKRRETAWVSKGHTLEPRKWGSEKGIQVRK
jgi:ribosomal protein L37E